MCGFIKAPNVAMGWGCCHCNTYNGIQRMECKACKVLHHEPLNIKGDCAIGIYYEDGGATNVKVLSVKADADGVGLELEATGTVERSSFVKPIPDGHIFNVWRKHDAGFYGGMWRLE